MKVRTVSVLILILATSLFAQEADTVLSVSKTLTDSTAVADTTLKSDNPVLQDTTTSASNEIDAIVYSTAQDSVSFSIPDKKMYIYGKGKLSYKNSKLNSGNIFVDFNTNQLEAFGIKDTSDTASGGLSQTPVLVEEGETYEGKNLRYNFQSKQGFITFAKNEMKASRYEGAKVKKVDAETYFIENGMFTPCESDTPHTHFTASEMKLINNEVIVAKWIWMYVAQIPVPIPLPFGVFPTQSGRRSGLIIPKYVQLADRGHGFRDFGYFWAINDYMDIRLLADYYSRGGYGLKTNFRYKKRYEYDGNISVNYAYRQENEERDIDYSEQRQWQLYLRHNQTINPTSSISANLNFMSSDYYSQTSINPAEGLRQNISSNATYQKRWDGASITIGYSRTQDISNNSSTKGNFTEQLPNISFQKSTFYPFKRSGNFPQSERNWYEMLSVNYSAKFLNKREQTSGNLKVKGGIQHNLSFGASPKIGYFNFTPNIRYTERWYNKRVVKYVTADTTFNEDGTQEINHSVQSDEMNELHMVRDFSVSMGTSTKLYGMLNLNALGIEAIRHTINPSISYSFTPDFSEDFWGYYDSYTDENGEEHKYSKFEGMVFGSPGSQESQSLNFSISNIWEMKTQKDPTDTTSKSEKITLLNMNASTRYNFVADKNKLSDLSLSYRTSLGDLLSLSGSNTFTFYDYNEDGTKSENYLASVGKGLMRMTRFSLSMNSSLSGEKLAGGEETEQLPISENDIAYYDNSVNEQLGIYQDMPPDFTIPWNLSLNLNYSYSQANPFSDPRKTATAGFSGGFNLTPKWKFNFSGSYDFIRKEFSAPRLTVHRDLHCWEMNFSWTPIGSYRGYQFVIRMKAPQFKDIKVEKNRGIYTGIR